MGLWTTLGKVGAYAGAPFTGGASLAALPIMSYIESKQKAKEPTAPTTTNNYSDPKSALNYFGKTNEGYIGDLRNTNTAQTSDLRDRFLSASDRAGIDYNNLQDNYRNFLGLGPISYMPSNQNFGAYEGYRNFADTGGYSNQDISNIRARANAPIRATYANAISDVDRRNVIAGGNLANASAAKAKMARELSYSLGDQSLNTEAMLAEAIRSGKLAGLSGMTGIDTSKMSEGLANAGNNLQAQGMEANRILGGLSGMSNLFGATPGMANMYGNQMLRSSDQNLQTEQLQNQLMDAIIRGSLGLSGQPGGFQKGMGNLATILSLIGQGASIYSGIKGTGSSSGAGDPNLPGGTKGYF